MIYLANQNDSRESHLQTSQQYKWHGDVTGHELFSADFLAFIIS